MMDGLLTPVASVTEGRARADGFLLQVMTALSGNVPIARRVVKSRATRLP